MTIAVSLLAEFEMQAPLTRRFLERMPEDQLTWQPHPRSMTAGQLAFHIANIPAAVVRFVQVNPAQARGFHFPQPASLQEILQTHDAGVTVVRELLPLFNNAAMYETWRLLAGDHELLAQARGQFLRDVMLSHWYQHRGQLGVYLRMLNIAVPATWGPSADEQPVSMQLLEMA